MATTNSTSVAYEAARIITTPAIINGFIGYNSKATAQYILIFDAKAIPNNGTVPILPLLVGATSSFGLDYGFHGRAFKNGLVLCTSSTPHILTLGSADCWFDVQSRSSI